MYRCAVKTMKQIICYIKLLACIVFLEGYPRFQLIHQSFPHLRCALVLQGKSILFPVSLRISSMAFTTSQPSAIDLSFNHTTNTAHAFAKRAEHASTNTTTSRTPETCVSPTDGQIIIARTTFIATLTAFALIACTSLLLLIGFIYRAHRRKKQNKAARTWGHKSRFDQRISMLRKEVDDSYTRQYAGCLTNPLPENPEMGSDSPVEIMSPERVWEFPAKCVRKSKGKSLFFDHTAGVWFPKR